MTATRKISVVFTLALALLAAIVMLAGLRPAEAAFPGNNGEIVFSSNQLTGPGLDGPGLYTTTVGGTVTKVPGTSSGDVKAVWSPDGSRIVFQSSSGSVNQEISVINANGSGRRQLTNTVLSGEPTEQEPAWSPDGSQIVFTRGGDVWVMNANGSSPTQLTSDPLADTQPAWSPDGSQIAFKRGTGVGDVWVMNADGTGELNITPDSPAGCSPNCYQGDDSHPAWSPDGTKIAYVHGYGPLTNYYAGGGKPNIWTMDPDDPGSSDNVNVSFTNARSDTEPAWSPDGTKIAMVGVTDTNHDIWVMNADGGSPTPVADLRHDISPDWQPIPVCTNTNATSGNDVITGTAGKDVLCGGDGNDTISGAGGNDIVLGEAGNDRLVGGSENDILNGGSGADTALYTGTSPVTANLTTQFATGVGSDTLPGIERLTGSDAGDKLTGSPAANVLVGGDGADEILGLGGNDTLKSRDERKNDTVNGGPGTDRCTTDNREISIKSCE